MFLGLFGCLFEHGGVERAGRLTAAALSVVAQDRGQPCWLLSLNDEAGTHSFVVDGIEHSSIGFGRDKLRFVAHAAMLAWRVRFAVLGHPHLAPMGQLLRLLNPKLKFWVASHGVEVWEPLKKMRLLALRKAEAVTAPSHYTVEQLVKVQGIPSSKAILLPYCLEPGFANHVPRGVRLALPTSLILTVGRLLRSEPGKGVDTVIRSLPRVLQVVPQTQYVVIGDGDHRPDLEQLAEKLGVSGNVKFLGHQTEEELRSYYMKADLFAMPSRQEGFGIVFLEAMSYGKPVIASAVGGASDIVIDGLTGFLVPYGDVDALADRIVQLLCDGSLRERLGNSGKDRIEANYTFDRFRHRLRDLVTEGICPA